MRACTHVCYICMLSPSDIVGEDIIFFGCPFILSVIRSSGQLLLPRYLMNGLKVTVNNHRPILMTQLDYGG